MNQFHNNNGFPVVAPAAYVVKLLYALLFVTCVMDVVDSSSEIQMSSIFFLILNTSDRYILKHKIITF